MSSSKSSQSSSQTYTDNRAVLGEGSLYANNGANVTSTSTNYVLDGGALQVAQRIADRALTGNASSTKDALTFGTKVLDASKVATDRALDGLEATQQLVAGAYEEAKGRGEWTDKLLAVAVVGALVVAGFAVKQGNA